jgi:hypothetical protein
MTCKKRIKPYFIFFILLFIASFSHAQGPDSSYTIPQTPFLAKIISIADLNTSINLSEESKIIPLNNTSLAPNAQKLYKSGNTIYVIIEQTGFVYKLMQHDSIRCVFKRLDHTINLNYNINCKNFIYKNDLFSYGGYGFWKSNGHLRKFNFQDSEWDIIPLNKEIISSYFLWFSEKQGRLYLPYQRIVNAGIAGAENITGVPIYKSYYLDVNTKKWEELGDLDADIINIIKNVNTSTEILSYQDGILFMANDDTYLFDYLHNKVYKSKNSNLNQFLIRRHNIFNMFIYNNEIYSYSNTTKSFITYPFKITDFELWSTSIWGVSAKLYYTIFGVLVFVIVVLSTIWFFNRSVKRKLEKAQLQLLKNKAITQAFTGTEVSLINLLLNSTIKGSVVEINQINHVLGIKDKNVGLQKKVRSDVMKAINDKYEFITQSNVTLIGSSRKEDDKRFYEYFITSSEIKTIQRLLEKNN